MITIPNGHWETYDQIIIIIIVIIIIVIIIITGKVFLDTVKQREKINAQRRAFIDPRRFHIICITNIIIIIIIIVLTLIIIVIIVVICLFPQLCSDSFCMSGTKLSASVNLKYDKALKDGDKSAKS